MTATKNKIEASLINLRVEEKLLSIGSSGNQFVVPPLGGRVSYKSISRYQTFPPKGGTTNRLLTQDHIINLENEPARRGAARKQDARQIAPVHPAKFRDSKRESLPFSYRYENLDRRLESEAFCEQHEVAGLAVFL